MSPSSEVPVARVIVTAEALREMTKLVDENEKLREKNRRLRAQLRECRGKA